MAPSIVIIDDEEEFSWLLAQYLRHKGAAVDCVQTGEQGLAHIRRQPPHVVLLDVHLPDHSGVELVQQIKAAAPATTVIMLSGSGDTRIVVTAIQRGADDYIQKPFDHPLLWQKICEYVQI